MHCFASSPPHGVGDFSLEQEWGGLCPRKNPGVLCVCGGGGGRACRRDWKINLFELTNATPALEAGS